MNIFYIRKYQPISIQFQLIKKMKLFVFGFDYYVSIFIFVTYDSHGPPDVKCDARGTSNGIVSNLC